MSQPPNAPVLENEQTTRRGTASAGDGWKPEHGEVLSLADGGEQENLRAGDAKGLNDIFSSFINAMKPGSPDIISYGDVADDWGGFRRAEGGTDADNDSPDPHEHILASIGNAFDDGRPGAQAGRAKFEKSDERYTKKMKELAGELADMRTSEEHHARSWDPLLQKNEEGFRINSGTRQPALPEDSPAVDEPTLPSFLTSPASISTQADAVPASEPLPSEPMPSSTSSLSPSAVDHKLTTLPADDPWADPIPLSAPSLSSRTVRRKDMTIALDLPPVKPTLSSSTILPRKEPAITERMKHIPTTESADVAELRLPKREDGSDNDSCAQLGNGHEERLKALEEQNALLTEKLVSATQSFLAIARNNDWIKDQYEKLRNNMDNLGSLNNSLNVRVGRLESPDVTDMVRSGRTPETMANFLHWQEIRDNELRYVEGTMEQKNEEVTSAPDETIIERTKGGSADAKRRRKAKDGQGRDGPAEAKDASVGAGRGVKGRKGNILGRILDKVEHAFLSHVGTANGEPSSINVSADTPNANGHAEGLLSGVSRDVADEKSLQSEEGVVSAAPSVSMGQPLSDEERSRRADVEHQKLVHQLGKEGFRPVDLGAESPLAVYTIETPRRAERFLGMMPRSPVVGFDVEKQFRPGSDSDAPSLIQLAFTERLVGIFHIYKMTNNTDGGLDVSNFPNSLRKVLGNPYVLKLGVGSVRDGKKIMDTYKSQVRGVVELGTFSSVMNISALSLDALYQAYVGEQLKGKKKGPGFKWDADPKVIGSEGLAYAAWDAAAGLIIFNRMLNRPKHNVPNALAGGEVDGGTKLGPEVGTAAIERVHGWTQKDLFQMLIHARRNPLKSDEILTPRKSVENYIKYSTPVPGVTFAERDRIPVGAIVDAWIAQGWVVENNVEGVRIQQGLNLKSHLRLMDDATFVLAMEQDGGSTDEQVEETLGSSDWMGNHALMKAMESVLPSDTCTKDPEDTEDTISSRNEPSPSLRHQKRRKSKPKPVSEELLPWTEEHLARVFNIVNAENIWPVKPQKLVSVLRNISFDSITDLDIEKAKLHTLATLWYAKGWISKVDGATGKLYISHVEPGTEVSSLGSYGKQGGQESDDEGSVEVGAGKQKHSEETVSVDGEEQIESETVPEQGAVSEEGSGSSVGDSEEGNRLDATEFPNLPYTIETRPKKWSNSVLREVFKWANERIKWPASEKSLRAFIYRLPPFSLSKMSKNDKWSEAEVVYRKWLARDWIVIRTDGMVVPAESDRCDADVGGEAAIMHAEAIVTERNGSAIAIDGMSVDGGTMGGGEPFASSVVEIYGMPLQLPLLDSQREVDRALAVERELVLPVVPIENGSSPATINEPLPLLLNDETNNREDNYPGGFPLLLRDVESSEAILLGGTIVLRNGELDVSPCSKEETPLAITKPAAEAIDDVERAIMGL
ncbi:hypothetical protein HK097_003401 [Rhizophlyctis rosea]|uniref:3'-5' exonuclease domain-containing protein n=1 Tax=Rhizophlyctis rosea TaxID=64517 RepID=A0AAD5SRA0_9FUNG|nr:hypothetical protein HK097_003401 [Rhizophlyctis rosea]